MVNGGKSVAELDTFLGKLPEGLTYGAEMRNSHWLREKYFGCLARPGATNVFNACVARRDARIP